MSIPRWTRALHERIDGPASEANDSRWRRYAPLTVVALAVVFNLWVLRAERLVVAYPNDSALHLQMVTLSHQLISSGQLPLSHWYPHLSLGSPFFVQYQSASAIALGAVSGVFGTATTFAWSGYLLLALWPICVYVSGRLLGWDRWESAIAAAISPLLFSITGRGFEDQSYNWLGAGLWSQLWAMWTLPLAWGFCWRYVKERRYLFFSVVTLALTIAFHFLTAYLAGLTLIVLVLIGPREIWVRVRRAALVGGCAVLATLWVTVPLLVDAKWTAVDQFQIGTTITDSYGARRILAWLLSGNIFDNGRLPVVTVLVGIGVVVCIARFRRDERARVVIGAGVLSLLLYFGRPTLGFVLNLLPGNQQLLFQRFIEGVQLAGLYLAGVGTVWLARTAWGWWSTSSVARARARRAVTMLGRYRVLIAVVLLVVVLTPAWSEISSYNSRNARWIHVQQTADATEGAQVQSLLALVDVLGGGRVYAGLPSNWGYHFLVGSVPVYNFLEDEAVDAVGLTLRTSSLMTDPEAYFDQYDPSDYDIFGVHYILMPAGDEPPVPATLLDRSGDYALWTVPDGGLVQVVSTDDAPIAANSGTLGVTTVGFLQSDLAARDIYPTIAYDGQPGAPATLVSGAAPSSPGVVTSQVDDLGNGRASATVSLARTSVVLLKAAFDPGWTVTVDGESARTEMVAPALVGVEVAPGVHHVVFVYRGYRHYSLLFLIGLLTLGGIVIAPVARRRFLGARTGRAIA